MDKAKFPILHYFQIFAIIDFLSNDTFSGLNTILDTNGQDDKFSF